nr:hypothetical protein CTI12_AA098640 [Tanacetum cinerariifolium]
MTKRRSKEAAMIRTVKVIENALDVATRIILLENVQNHRKTRTKDLLSKALGAITVKKMMRRSKMKRVSQLMHQVSDDECSTSGGEDEEYAMEVRDFKKFFKRR